jgi:hypothetical protein
MIKNKQHIQSLSHEILRKLEMLSQLSKEDLKTDFGYFVGCAKESVEKILYILKE